MLYDPPRFSDADAIHRAQRALHPLRSSSSRLALRAFFGALSAVANRKAWHRLTKADRPNLGLMALSFRILKYKSKRRVRRARAALFRTLKSTKSKSVEGQLPYGQPAQGPSRLLALEPRIVFDAAMVETADAAADQVAQQQAEAAVQVAQHGESGAGGSGDTAETEAGSDLFDFQIGDVGQGANQEIAFVDRSVEDAGAILSAFGPQVEIVFIESYADGVQQIASALAGRDDIDVIHIISHGQAGELRLGTATLSESAMRGGYADELTGIGAALGSNADILIYGCNFGADAKGASAVEALGELTGADIAASDDDTGHADLGGDWDLEVEAGAIEAEAVEAADWNHVLAPLEISATNPPVLTQGGTVDLGPNINPLVTGSAFVPAPTYSEALWTNAGTVGGVAIDLRATVLSRSLPDDMAILFQNIGDDPTVVVLTGPGGAGGTAQIVWEVFQSGTNQTVAAFGAPTITVSDIDGNGAPNTIETVAPALDGLLSAEIDGGSELQLSAANGIVTATGTSQDPTNGLTNTRPSAAVKFSWSERSSWTISYTAERGEDGRLYQNDGDGDFVFLPPTTIIEFAQLDLDANDSTASGTASLTQHGNDGTPTQIVDVDTTISNVSATLNGGSLSLTNPQAGDTLSVNGVTGNAGTVPGTSISFVISGPTVTFSGSGTAADYETALKSVQFVSTTATNSLFDRTFNVVISTPDGAGGAINTDIAVATVQLVEQPDTDGDGVADLIDVDDDNDGILDTVEGYVPGGVTGAFPFYTYAPVVGQFAAGPYTVSWDINGSLVSAQIQDLAAFGQFLNNNDPDGQEWTVDPVTSAVVRSPTPAPDFSQASADILATYGTITVTHSQTGSPSSLNANVTGGLTTEQSRNTDGDGLADHLDIDSDDDGITDNIEAQTTAGYIAPSGVGAGITDANNDGLDDVYDTRNVTSGTAAATAVDARIAPVNTDAAGTAGVTYTADATPDYLDLDSDGDGIGDSAENGLGAAFPAPGQGDTDGDGLKDVYETVIDGNVNDGFVVNEGVTDPLTAQANNNGYLPDDGDTAGGAAIVPLITDLNWRDAKRDNTAPIAEDDALTGNEDTSVNADLFADNGAGDADRDPDGDTFTVTRVAADSNVAALAGLSDGAGVDTASDGSVTVSGSNGGMFTVQAEGSVVFDPGQDFQDLAVGEDRTTQVVYQIDDGNGATDTAVVTYTVTGLNDPVTPFDPLDPNTPPADTDAYIPHQAGLDGAAVTSFNLTPYFTDADTTDTVSLSIDPNELPTGLMFNPMPGVISGTPTASASQGGPNSDGVYPITVTASDGNGSVISTTVRYTISNPAPIAENDDFTGDEQTVVDGNLFADNGAGDVDRDPDGDTITVTRVAVGSDVSALSGLSDGTGLSTTIAGTQGGVFTVLPDGSVTFDPNGGFEGLGEGETETTQIVYQIDDGQGGIDQAVVSYTVTGVNDAPLPLNDTASTDQDTATTLTPLANDSDVDGPSLEITEINGVPLVGGTATLPSGAIVTVDSNGILTYDPNGAFDDLPPGAATTDVLTYTVSDNDPTTPMSEHAVIEVTVTGTQGAITTTDNANRVGEDATAPATGNMITDDDGDGVDSLVDGLPRSQINFGVDFADEASVLGATTIDGVEVTIATGGDLTLVNGQYGTAEHNMQGGENGFMVVQQNASALNTANALETSFAFDQAIENVSFNVLDVDRASDFSSQDQVQVLAYDASGTQVPVTVRANTVFTDQVGDAFTGELSGVDGTNTNGNLYVEIAGPVSRIVVATTSGPDVTATNPGTQLIGIGDVSWDHATGNVLTVRDVNGQTNPATDITGTYGTLDWNDGGGYSYAVNAANAAVQALDDGEALTDTFTYTAVDSSGQASTSTLTITIGGTNDAPKVQDPNAPGVDAPKFALPDLVNNDADPLTGGTEVDLGQYFFDVETGDTLAFNISGLPAGLTFDPASGTVTGTIDSSASVGGPLGDGVYPVSVEVSDGTDTTTVTFDWTISNPPPAAEDDAFTTDEDVALSDNVIAPDGDGDGGTAGGDPDGDAITLQSVLDAGNNVIAFNVPTQLSDGSGELTIRTDGSFDFTPNPSFNGTATFDYVLVDADGATDTATARLTIVPVNDPPVLNLDTDNDSGTPGDLSDDDADDANFAVTFTEGDAAVGVVDGDVAVIDLDNVAMTTLVVDIAGLVDLDQPGAEAITIGGEKMGLESNALATVTAGGTNFLLNYQVDVAGERGQLTITSASPLAPTMPISDIDMLLATLTYENASDDPDAGDRTFTFTATDPLGAASNSPVATVSVVPVNDAPVIEASLPNLMNADSDAYTGVVGGDTTTFEPVDLNPFFSDVDHTDPELTITATNLPTGLSVMDNEIVGTIDRSASQGGNTATPGVYEVTVTATDRDGEAVPQTFTWTVTNPVPIAENETGTLSEDDLQLAGDVIGAAAGQAGDVADNDPDGDVIVVTSVANGADTAIVGAGAPAMVRGDEGGTFVLNGYGSYTFAPGDDFNGLAVGESVDTEVTYTITDADGAADTATLTITVTGVNDAPIPVDPAQPPIDPLNPPSGVPFDPQSPFTPPIDPLDYIPGQTGEDSVWQTPLNLTPYFGDPDSSDAVVLTIDLADLPPGLTFDGTAITGRPTPEASQLTNVPGGVPGTYVIPVTATDPHGATFTTNVTYSITNPVPIAEDDSLVGDEDTVTVGQVFDNNGVAIDSDPDGDTIMVSAVDGLPANLGQPVTGSNGGVFTIEADGTVTFDPSGHFEALKPGESVATKVTYTITDGNGGTDTATVTYTVTGLDDAPLVGTPSLNQSHEDGETIQPVDLSGAIDNPTGNPLTFSADGLPPGLTIDPTTGEVTGTVDVNASLGGPYPVTLTANDPLIGQTATTPILWSVSNPPPVAEDDTTATAIDTPVTVSVIGNDSDPDGDDLRVDAITTPPVGGIVVINADGTVTYTPNAGFSGTETFTYEVSDGNGGVDTADVTVVIGGPAPSGMPTTIPLAAQANADAETITPVDVSMAFNAPGGQPLTFTATDLPPGLEIDPTTGVVSGTIDPSASASGPFEVTVTAVDPDGNTASQTFTWAVSNPVPTAVADQVSTALDTPVTLSVVANDVDPDGDGLSVYSINGVPSNGIVIMNDDGTVTYTPDTDFSGTDTFTYLVTDGEGGFDDATVTVVVGDPAPAVPTVTPLTPAGGPDGETIKPIDTGAAFLEPDGHPLTFTATGLPEGLTIDPMTGEITGALQADASQGGPNGDGTYPVAVTGTDPDGNQVTTTLVFTATNPAPEADDDVASTAPNVPVVISVVANDSDGGDDADGLTVTAIATPPKNGTVVINGDDTVTYTPDAGFEGTDTFTYEVSDGQGGTDVATVRVDVTPTPTGLTSIPVVPNQAGQDAVPMPPVDMSEVLSDPEGEPLMFTSIDLPPGLMINPATGVISGTPTSDASQGGDDLVNAPGIYTTTVIGTDPTGNATQVTVSYSITNPSPVAEDDRLTGDEDTPLTAGLFDPNGTATGDVDPDEDVITVTRVAAGNDVAALDQITHGTDVGVAILGSAGGEFTVLSNGTVTFDPAGDFEDLGVGETAVTEIVYQIDDGQGGTDQAVVTYTVTGVNDAPIPVDPTQPTVDPNDPTLSVPVDPQTPFAPPADPQDYIPAQSGQDAVAQPDLDLTPYFGDPDRLDQVTVSIDPNDLPPGLTFDPVKVVISGMPASDASQQTNVVNGTPGVYVIPVTATDPHGATFTTNVTYTLTNPAPVAEDDVLNGDEDTQVTVSLFDPNGTAIGDTDPDGDVIVVSAINGDPTLVGTQVPGSNGGTFSVQPDGNVVFDPSDDFQGLGVGQMSTTQVTYTVNDNQGGTDTATVVYTVTGVNDAPIPVDPTQPPIDPNDPPLNVPFDPQTPLVPPIDPLDYVPVQPGGDAVLQPDLDLTPYFGDPDGPDAVTLSVDPNDLPLGLTFDPATGVISGTPTSCASQGGPNSDGVYPISVTATDPSGATFTTVVTYAITNTPPAASPDVTTGRFEADIVVDLLANDRDPDGDAIQVVSATVDPAAGTVAFDGQDYVFTPAPGYAGDAVITYVITDADGAQSVSTHTVTVPPGPIVQDAPTGPSNGAPTLDPFEAPPLDTDGIVLDTVAGLEPEFESQSILDVSGIVVSTVNGVNGLRGFGDIGTGNGSVGRVIQDTATLSELSNAANLAFDNRFGSPEPDPLFGFSIRMDVPTIGNAIGEAGVGQIVVETLKRDQVIYLQVSNTFGAAGHGEVQAYKVSLPDGAPLPRWVSQADQGVLLADVPAEGGVLDLKITAILEDGTTSQRGVSLELSNGEIRPLDVPDIEPGKTFEEQLQAQ
ncbi:MAG: Ig-like domain-containing protein [Pseudomonadota bacterium]